MKAEMGKNLSAVAGVEPKDKKAPARRPGIEERQYTGKASALNTVACDLRRVLPLRIKFPRAVTYQA
jgi:hypothetical protein